MPDVAPPAALQALQSEGPALLSIVESRLATLREQEPGAGPDTGAPQDEELEGKEAQ